MRTILAATALLLPSLLPAQALHAGVSHLVAAVDAPAFAFQASALSAVQPHVFSGLIAPVRLTAIQLAPAADMRASTVLVQYTVDTAGVPQNIVVTGAPNEATRNRVTAAIEKVRYTPGRLDGQVVATPVSMHLSISQ